MSSSSNSTASASTFSTRAAWKVAKSTGDPKQTRSRKGAKPRSWTEKEKNYLLASRDRRVSYRRIAASLGKTELACRLHYHQLTVVKARQDDKSYTAPMQPPSTPMSICSAQSPEEMYTRDSATSPPMEQRTLPSLTRWFDQCGHYRSASLPTPLAPQYPAPWRSQYTRTPSVALSPPTPPATNFQSPYTPRYAGLGLTSDKGHYRASSYSSTQTTSPRLFAPTPMLSPGFSSAWRPRATRGSSISSNESRAALSPPYSRTSPICSSNSVASSDRCSVHSLLNHDDEKQLQ